MEDESQINFKTNTSLINDVTKKGKYCSSIPSTKKVIPGKKSTNTTTLLKHKKNLKKKNLTELRFKVDPKKQSTGESINSTSSTANNTKKLMVHRTPVTWGRKPYLPAKETKCYYLHTDENSSVDNTNNQNISINEANVQSVKKNKNLSALYSGGKKKTKISIIKDSIHTNSFVNNSPRKKDLSLTKTSDKVNLKSLEELNNQKPKNASKIRPTLNKPFAHKKNSASIRITRHNMYNNSSSVLQSNNTKDNIDSISSAFSSQNRSGTLNTNEYFEYNEEKQIELSSEEKSYYGDRTPKGYKKIKLIGKGGCSIVWLVSDENGGTFAAKQISKKPKSTEIFTSFYKENGLNQVSHCSLMAKKEIEIMQFLKENSPSPIIIDLHDTYEDNNDIWLIFEIGGKSLSGLCWKIKGEFLGTERIYLIRKGRFLHKLTSDLSQFKKLIRTILELIKKLNESNVIHSDIKPDNILIDYDPKDYSIKNIKMIDFGSSYFLDNPINFSSNTPEYMSPEITCLIEKGSSTRETIQFLNKLTKWPWCIDMWSLGVTLLEIVLACPLWMSYKAKVIIKDKAIFTTGLFGVKGRDGNKIYHKQVEISKKLKKLLKNCLIDDEDEKEKFYSLLSRMLELDYRKRISPKEALNHEFLRDSNFDTIEKS